MKLIKISISIFLSIVMALSISAQDGLPKVFSDYTVDKTGSSLREQAKAASISLQINSGEEYLIDREKLRSTIKSLAKVSVFNNPDMKMIIGGSIDMGTYRIDNISYQSSPGIYVTANLYIPKGKGTFPAVVNLHGHWPNGRCTEISQTTAQLLALNGYVCLNIDAWGAGERGSNEHEHEYHGSSLGASLMDIDQNLLGLQLTDNIRGVDLLCSLPFVDKERIGATGASGGGNQAMWLSAMDERIKAAVPVVSVGSFESYIMNSNCVCELLPKGLTFTEEDGILGLIAPRALKILTGMNDANPSFSYIQMLKSYNNVKKVYEFLNRSNNITYQLFNTGHGYWPEMQMAMLDWFDMYLKEGKEKTSIGLDMVKILPIEQLATYAKGKRPEEVITTEKYCISEGEKLKEKIVLAKDIDIAHKAEELKETLSIRYFKNYRRLHTLNAQEGWDRVIIETNEGRLIPFLHKAPAGSGKDYTIICHPQGKDSIPASFLSEKTKRGEGLILTDLWGIGESRSDEAIKIDGALPPFHTLSRSVIWLGETVMGKWVSDIDILVKAVQDSYDVNNISFAGFRETGIAILFFAATDSHRYKLTLYDTPVSYLFDNRENVDYFNMAIHIPGFLRWGDISLATALSASEIIFVRPVSMSGRKLSDMQRKKIESEYMQMADYVKKKRNYVFTWD